MSIEFDNSWSYYLVNEAQNSALIDSPLYGVCDGQLSLTVRSLKSGDPKLEVTDALNSTQKISSIEVFSTFLEEGCKCEVGLELFDLAPAISIFDLCLVDGVNSRVKIASLVMLPMTSDIRPVTFVVGSPRSGTTAIGNLVQLAYDTKVHGESHVGQAFQELIEKGNAFFNHSSAALDKGTLVQEVPALYIEAQLVLNLRDLYHRFYCGQAIVDKTPGIKMIECLPLLFKAFPHANVIYCQRRGIENIASRMRKFVNVPFEGHCRQWKRSLTVWQKLKNTITKDLGHSDWCVQIEQFDLAKTPIAVIKELLVFLDIPLNKQKKLQRYLERSAPQKTGNKPEEVYSLLSINWTQEQKELFLLHCEDLMQSNGYSLDESYYLSR
jgi:hypothetical protein